MTDSRLSDSQSRSAADAAGDGLDTQRDAVSPVRPSQSPTEGFAIVSVNADEPPFNPPGYEILGTLGRGGMGIVYKARQPQLKRLVALKMVLAGNRASPDELTRFRAEAEAVARLQHPNIVQIYEVGEHNGLPFFSLEFVEGGSLSQKLDGSPLAPRLAAQLLETLARAIHFAHQHGIVHRDLKPANILLPRDDGGRTKVESAKNSQDTYYLLPTAAFLRPKITDFGLAKQLDSDAGQTRSGAILGTPNYMSPEQAEGRTREIGPAADIYSLGSILYELLTGRPPFRGESPMDTLMMVIHRDPVPPSRLQPKVPRDLETICLKCLEKEPAKRYATAQALAEDLRRYLADEPIRARPVGYAEQVRKWARRRPAVAALLGLVLAVSLCGFVGVTWQWLQTREALEKAQKSRQAEIDATEAAQEQAIKATQAQRDAEDQAARLRRLLYVSNLNIASEAWNTRRTGRVLELLNNLRPQRGQEDLRSFEWHCMWRQCHGERTTLDAGEPTSRLAYSPDGKTLAVGCPGGIVQLWDLTTGKQLARLEGTHIPAGSARVAFSPDGKLLAVTWDSLDHRNGELQLWDVATRQRRTVWKQSALTCLAFSPDGRQLALGIWGASIALWDVSRQEIVQRLRGPADGECFDLAFSPDGKLVAAPSSDKTVWLWDLATGKERAVLRGGHQSRVWSVAFSPDGKLLASGGEHDSLKLWNLDTLSVHASVSIPNATVWSLAFSPDSRFLAGACNLSTQSGEIRLWELAGMRQKTFTGHLGEVNSVKFSPDGQTVASASDDHTIKLWDVFPWPEWQHLPGHFNSVTGLAVTLDGKTAASRSLDQTIKLWDLTTGELLHTLTGHTGVILEVAFSPDGKTLVSADKQGAVKLWEVRTGQEKYTITSKRPKLAAAAFAPDGQTVAIGATNAVEFLDVASRKIKDHLEFPGPVNALAYSRDGRFLAIGGFNKTAWIQDLTTNTHTSLEGHTDVIGCVAFSPDSQRLATGSYDRLIKLWDPVTGKLQTTLRGHNGRVHAVDFAPDGKTLLSGSDDATMKLWDPAMGTETGTLISSYSSSVYGAAFVLDGEAILAGRGSGNVSIWDATTRQERFNLGGPQIETLAFSPDGRTLASGYNQNVKLWDPATGKALATLRGHRFMIRSVAFSPDGKTLVSADGDPWRREPGQVKLWDVATRTERRTLQGFKSGIMSVAFSPNGKLLATGTGNIGGPWEVKLWDVATGRELRTLTGHKLAVHAVAFSPDGRLLASADGSNWSTISASLKLWDVATGKEIAGPEKTHRSPITSLVFTPDGKTIATGSWDHSVKLWDVATGKERALLLGHTKAVRGLAISPDGRRLVSVSTDMSIRFWDPDTGQELAALKDHLSAISSVAFAPDGQTLATGSWGYDSSGGIRLWPAAPDGKPPHE